MIKTVVLVLVMIAGVSCSPGVMQSVPAGGEVEFVWGQRRIVGLEVPLGNIKPGVGIWMTTSGKKDVEVTTVEK